MPKNVSIYFSLEELKKSNSKGYLIVSDKIIEDAEILEKSVVYRPPSLVVGVGLHWNTPKNTIKHGIESILTNFKLSEKSIVKLVSIKKDQQNKNLAELANEMEIPVEYHNRDDLAMIPTPNPSKTVQFFEGTSSVSEAAALKSSEGSLVVEKQKFPPDLTIAIARISD